MVILFPHEPFAPSQIDSAFEAEFDAAQAIGFRTAFYDHEALECEGARNALARVPKATADRLLVHRGWMIPGETYASLHKELLARGYQPQVTPAAYEEAHYLPNAYRHLEGETPRSEWIEGDDEDAAWKLYQDFSDRDAIIKDWVKSAKSRWKDGCFIPAHTNEQRFREIFRVFREERSKLFNRGVVLREYIPVVTRGTDVRGLPLVDETRLFFWRGEILVRPGGSAPNPLDELPRWRRIAQRFMSPFLTIDVACLTDGSWMVIEVGDGGVSGLPAGLDPERFYAALWNRVTETGA